MSDRKYAVITGASAGIGMQFARELAKRGYNLVLVARRRERMENLASELEKEYGSHCHILVCDLSDRESCDILTEGLQDIPVEIFINNAGFGDCNSFMQGDMEKELQMIDVNIKALHILLKRMLIQMNANNRGYILNVASSAGLIPAGPYMATYYATKAYVTSITQGVARELKEAGSNVYVGCLCPGPVDTEFNDVAGVEFSLKGITAQECVAYAIDQMFRRKTVIIPTWYMRAAVFFGRFLPRSVYVAITSMQQKKKLERKVP